MKKNSKFFADIEMKKPQQKPRYVNIYRHLHTNTHTHTLFSIIILFTFCTYVYSTTILKLIEHRSTHRQWLRWETYTHTHLMEIQSCVYVHIWYLVVHLYVIVVVKKATSSSSFGTFFVVVLIFLKRKFSVFCFKIKFSMKNYNFSILCVFC